MKYYLGVSNGGEFWQKWSTGKGSGKPLWQSCLENLISLSNNYKLELMKQCYGNSNKISSLLVKHACMLSCFSHVWLFVSLWTITCQAPLSMKILLQGRILECVAMSSSRESPWPRDWASVSYLLHWHVNSLSLGHLRTLNGNETQIMNSSQ